MMCDDRTPGMIVMLYYLRDCVRYLVRLAVLKKNDVLMNWGFDCHESIVLHGLLPLYYV